MSQSSYVHLRLKNLLLVPRVDGHTPVGDEEDPHLGQLGPGIVDRERHRVSAISLGQIQMDAPTATIHKTPGPPKGPLNLGFPDHLSLPVQVGGHDVQHASAATDEVPEDLHRSASGVGLLPEITGLDTFKRPVLDQVAAHGLREGVVEVRRPR